MRMVKEILGQSVVVEAFCFEVSRRCYSYTHQNNKKHKISVFPSFSCSSVPTSQELMNTVRLPAAATAAPAQATAPFVKRRTTVDDLNSSNKSVHDDGGVTLTISASVTIKNSKELMTTMLHYFDSFNNNTTGDRGIVMQLVSTQIDPTTMEGKLSKRVVLDWSRELLFHGGGDSERSTHKIEFEIDSNFGFPGAITVTNKYDKEIFLETISIEGGFVEFSCNSWVQPEKVHPNKRIFFTNKACLPCDTAEGVKELRKEELRQKRGDGKGMRKVMSDRVYDYDVYNDLGNPDKGIQHVRPILGTKQYPNPRRCRTGRPPVITDEKYESCVNAFMETYVPRDEVFEGVRKEALDVERVKGITRNLIPFIRTCITKCGVFKELSDTKNIYKRRHQVDEMKHTNEENGTLSIDVNKLFQDSFDEYFKFSTPHIISGNGCCIRDEELGRQALAGVNPLSIKRLQTFPPVSDLDPSMYGPQESALKEEHIINHLDGMSVQQAIEEKKLFILDYHDAYMPFLKGINAQEDRKAYATRTILYLTKMGTLKPIAIELSLPEGEHQQQQQQQSKQVLTPPLDATSYWLWQLAKAHVCSNDAGLHQLVHHWLRTHACMEPFIIAAHRQMSVTHPIFKLLKPHMKCTLQINALAREALINGGGIIESDFSTGRYSTEIVSAAYKDWWRFDMEALPADLIRRGLAEPDRTQPQGIKLTIEDYPYANDGLLIWFALERMVRTYVNYYYHNGLMVRSDTELQGWYNEVINVGHGDHANATWWPTLATPRDLISVLTTLIWIASVQHSAVNFGQYPLGGYVPMRPPLVKKLLPKEGDPEYKEFLEDPEGFLCSSLPDMFQTTKFLAVLNILSQHPEDEEYIGQRRDLSDWIGDPEIIEAFYEFSIELKRIEKEIEKRNKDQNLRNRCGAGIPPYELLIASSGPGVTCRGVPNSIST